MTEAFDEYHDNYKDVVEESIGFSGLSHDFFMQAKADILHSILTDQFPQTPFSNLDYLDVGCGVGTFHPYVQTWFKSIQGCDTSAQSISRAKIANKFVNYLSYNGSRLPYNDQSMDIITAICVVHHVPVEQWHSFFSEIRRVLRPGGVVCVIEHNPYNPGTRLAVARCPFDHDAVLLTHKKAKRLLKNAGFEVPQSRHFLLFPTHNRFARKIENSMRRIPLGAQYVAIAHR